MGVVEFVEKLLTILECENSIMRWNEEGTQFEILCKQEFVRTILPTYFRHKKFESFIRQVNMYGFHKVNRRKGALIFRHENFRRGVEQSLRLIRRVKKANDSAEPVATQRYEMREQVRKLQATSPNLVEFVKQLTVFMTQNPFDHKQLRLKLEKMSKEVPAKTDRRIKPIVSSLREKIGIIEEISKKVSNVRWTDDEDKSMERGMCEEIEEKQQNKVQIKQSPCEQQKRYRHKEGNNPLKSGTKPEASSLKIMSAPLVTNELRELQEQTIQRNQSPYSMLNMNSFPSISSFLD